MLLMKSSYEVPPKPNFSSSCHKHKDWAFDKNIDYDHDLPMYSFFTYIHNARKLKET